MIPQAVAGVGKYGTDGMGRDSVATDRADGVTGSRKMRLLPAILCAIMAVVTIGIGAWVLLSATGSTTLRCERASASCALTNSRIRGSTTRHFVLGEVHQATVQESTTGGSGGSSRLAYRVAIETTGDTVPFSDVYSPGRDDKQRTADSFNAFLGDQQQGVFEYRSSERKLSLIGLAFLGFGGLFVGLAARQVVSLRQAKAGVADQVLVATPVQVGSRAGGRGGEGSSTTSASSGNAGVEDGRKAASGRASRRRRGGKR
jgi:hypothetical protein